MIDPSSRVHCTHSSECPGCPLIDAPYGEQLEAKHRRVVAAVARFSELASTGVAGVAAADPLVEYRRRAKLAVSGRAVGLYARGSHRVVDSPECRVLDELVLGIAGHVRRLSDGTIGLRALDIARTPEGALVTLVVDDDADERLVRDFASRLRAAEPRIVGIAVGRRDVDSPRLLGRAPTSLSGVSSITMRDEDAGPYHYVAHGTFAQAHAGQRHALERAVVSELSSRMGAGKGRVLELFAGAGALALSLSAAGARVHAVESYGPAAELARRAAAEQSLDVVVEADDAERAASRLVAAGERFEAVVVNPPRRGLSPLLRKRIAELGPAVIAYVSCEPTTLARDLADFARHGFSAPALAPYDMMPLTEEVETLAVLVRAPAPVPDVVFSDDRLIVVAKAPHEPTIPQGEHESSLLDRVRRLERADAAVPVHRLDVGTSGVCLFARRPEFVTELSEALSAGRKEYVALLRGIARKKGSVNRALVEHGRAREARTRYARIEVVGGHSLVSVVPDQGRKHQVRRHLASIGSPIVGDERYGDAKTNAHFSARHGLDRPFLHLRAITLLFADRELALAAPLAPDLELVLESLTASRNPC